jgi:peptidoglycan/xylan/chitin deacetylase (PgdA/CDA1 family)
MRIFLCFLTLSLLVICVIQTSYAQTQSCRCVAFRLDDVQDFHLNNAQIAVMGLFEKKNASLTLGIIGNHIGNDPRLVNHLKEVMNHGITNNSHIEIASHGWNHEDFRQFSKDEQSALMEQSIKKISTVLGVVPRTFIPPFDTFNNDTLDAAQRNGIHYFSASGQNDPPPYDFQNVTVYHFPETAATGDIYSNGSNWFSYPHQQILDDVLASLDNQGFAVVVAHPQDHSIRKGEDIANKVDWQQIKEDDLLIDQIRNMGLKIVTIGEIKHNMSEVGNNSTNNSTNSNFLPYEKGLKIVTIGI